MKDENSPRMVPFYPIIHLHQMSRRDLCLRQLKTVSKMFHPIRGLALEKQGRIRAQIERKVPPTEASAAEVPSVTSTAPARVTGDAATSSPPSASSAGAVTLAARPWGLPAGERLEPFFAGVRDGVARSCVWKAKSEHG